MPVTYFKVKPESAMYKNFFIENTERKKLKKHISEFMKNHVSRDLFWRRGR